MKVLLAMPGRECLKSTSAESARHFMQERLYNSSQYKREPAGKKKENSESIDNTILATVSMVRVTLTQ